MKMFSKTTLRKTAFTLFLVAFISLIPSNTFRVLAEGDIVPAFPYDELQTIGENDYVLFKVHGVEQVDYIECIAPKIHAPGNYEHVLPGLSYSGLGGWVLQINSIDYYFKDGKSIYFDLQSLFTTSYMPVENDDPYYSAWLEFVYASEDVFGIDEDSYSQRGVRFFKAQNFIIEPAATPTPTPEASSPFLSWTDYDNTNAFSVVWEQNGQYYAFQNLSYVYRDRIWYGNCEGQKQQISGSHIPFPYSYPILGFAHYSTSSVIGIHTVDYSEEDHDYYSTGNFQCTELPGQSGDIYNCDWGSFKSFRSVVFFQPLDDIRIVATNHAVANGYLVGGNGGTVATPTPTSAPTPIPQPSATPAPDDERPGWGWGIVSTLRYIFIPDKNKLIRLEKTATNRFQQFGGGYDDLKRVSGFEDPVRPQNVVMNWKPFGSDSEDEQQQITLVDFEQIDFYLFRTASGQFICDCLKASFTFLMFGYLIHVIRKHFVIENNTSDENDGGGD